LYAVWTDVFIEHSAPILMLRWCSAKQYKALPVRCALQEVLSFADWKCHIYLYYMASPVSGQDESNPALWWSYLARSGLLAVSRKKNFLESNIINPLLTKLVRSRWLDIILDSSFFCVFMERDGFEVHKHAKKQDLGQYPAILTEQAWSITHTCQKNLGESGFGCNTLISRCWRCCFVLDKNSVWTETNMEYWWCAIGWWIQSIRVRMLEKT